MASGEDWEAEAAQLVINRPPSSTSSSAPNEAVASTLPSAVTPAEDSLLDTEWTRPQKLPLSTDSTSSSSSTQPSSVPDGDMVDGASPLQHAEIALLEPLVEQIESVGLDEARPATATQVSTNTEEPMSEATLTAEPALPDADVPASVPTASVASNDIGWTEDPAPAPTTAPKPTANEPAAQDDWDKQVVY